MKERVFLGLAGLLLGISLGLRPWKIRWSSPANPQKTLSFPPLLLRLTQYLVWFLFLFLLIAFNVFFFYLQKKLFIKLYVQQKFSCIYKKVSKHI